MLMTIFNLHSTYLKNLLPNITISSLTRNDELWISTTHLIPFMRFLRDHSMTQCKQLSDIAVIDIPSNSNYRFSVNYILYSPRYSNRIILNTQTNELAPLTSVTSLFPSANWLEREAWDLFGIFFTGHNDLRRILTDYNFQGHPLRKDFPLTGFNSLMFSDLQKRIVYNKTKLTQEFRVFNLQYTHYSTLIVLPQFDLPLVCGCIILGLSSSSILEIVDVDSLTVQASNMFIVLTKKSVNWLKIKLKTLFLFLTHNKLNGDPHWKVKIIFLYIFLFTGVLSATRSPLIYVSVVALGFVFLVVNSIWHYPKTYQNFISEVYLKRFGKTLPFSVRYKLIKQVIVLFIARSIYYNNYCSWWFSVLNGGFFASVVYAIRYYDTVSLPTAVISLYISTWLHKRCLRLVDEINEEADQACLFFVHACSKATVIAFLSIPPEYKTKCSIGTISDSKRFFSSSKSKKFAEFGYQAYLAERRQNQVQSMKHYFSSRNKNRSSLSSKLASTNTLRTSFSKLVTTPFETVPIAVLPNIITVQECENLDDIRDYFCETLNLITSHIVDGKKLPNDVLKPYRVKLETWMVNSSIALSSSSSSVPSSINEKQHCINLLRQIRIAITKGHLEMTGKQYCEFEQLSVDIDILYNQDIPLTTVANQESEKMLIEKNTITHVIQASNIEINMSEVTIDNSTNGVSKLFKKLNLFLKKRVFEHDFTDKNGNVVWYIFWAFIMYGLMEMCITLDQFLELVQKWYGKLTAWRVNNKVNVTSVDTANVIISSPSIDSPPDNENNSSQHEKKPDLPPASRPPVSTAELRSQILKQIAADWDPAKQKFVTKMFPSQVDKSFLVMLKETAQLNNSDFEALAKAIEDESLEERLQELKKSIRDDIKQTGMNV